MAIFNSVYKSFSGGGGKLREKWLINQEIFNKWTSLPISNFSIAKSWNTVESIVINFTFTSTGSWQLFTRIVDSDQTLSDLNFLLDFYSMTPWWDIQIWKDGVSWTTYFSWWTVAFNTPFECTLTLGKTSWNLNINWTDTALTYTTAFASYITTAFASSNLSCNSRFVSYGWTWILGSDFIVTVNYE